jgi:hypothetical protein
MPASTEKALHRWSQRQGKTEDTPLSGNPRTLYPDLSTHLLHDWANNGESQSMTRGPLSFQPLKGLEEMALLLGGQSEAVIPDPEPDPAFLRRGIQFHGRGDPPYFTALLIWLAQISSTREG